jgi:hypothetical protein
VGVQGDGLHARQSSLGAVQNRGRHVQIALQGGAPGRGRRRFGGRLGFEEQLGLVEQKLADQGRGVAPGRIQLPGLPRIAAMPSEHRGHALAVLQADTGHRHKELHRHVGGGLALAHLLLDGLRQKIDQGQPPRDPTRAAIKAAGQLLPSITVALLQLRQQPALFQRGLRFGPAQRAVQEQCLDFAQGPDHRFHRVPAQLLEGGQALVAINDQVAVRLAFDRHHHDRRLLPHFRQRGQQAPLPSWVANPQMLPTPIQLVKLQLHSSAPLRRQGLVCTKQDRVLPARRGKCVSNRLGIKVIGPELVLCEVPGKRPAFLNPAGDKVVRVARPPSSLGLAATCGLAFHFTTSPLPHPHARIGAEPMAADAAGSFPSIRHGDYHHRAVSQYAQ